MTLQTSIPDNNAKVSYNNTSQYSPTKNQSYGQVDYKL
jgi:hypothetical protein